MGDEGRTCAAPIQALKILFITLEFRTGTFSGNGVYATAQVRALAAAGHQVFVISAAPAHAKSPDETFGVVKIHEVLVSSWHSLDAGGPWREFAAGVTEADDGNGSLGTAVAAFVPDVVMAVDWSALQAVRNLAPYCGGAPYVYLNYRVFTRTAMEPDLDLIRGLEAAAMSESLLTVALSRSDADYLANHVAVRHTDTEASPPPPLTTSSPPPLPTTQLTTEPTRPAAALVKTHKPKVLLPALREDVWQLEPPAEVKLPVPAVDGDRGFGGSCGADDVAAAAAAWAASRPYLSCFVRLSREKEPERFVALVEAMASGGLLQRYGITPLLLGVANDPYAQGLKARLRAAAPVSIILESFIGPSELAALYRKTRLNFHPSTYDAYGMTIVEAASQGAPSVVHDGGGAVGATDLLRGPEGEVFLLNLKAPAEQVANAVSRLLEAPMSLAATSGRAMRRARSWDEAANAAELVRLVREAMSQGSTG